jgi:hypothetical protein
LTTVPSQKISDKPICKLKQIRLRNKEEHPVRTRASLSNNVPRQLRDKCHHLRATLSNRTVAHPLKIRASLSLRIEVVPQMALLHKIVAHLLSRVPVICLDRTHFRRLSENFSAERSTHEWSKTRDYTEIVNHQFVQHIISAPLVDTIKFK